MRTVSISQSYARQRFVKGRAKEIKTVFHKHEIPEWLSPWSQESCISTVHLQYSVVCSPSEETWSDQNDGLVQGLEEWKAAWFLLKDIVFFWFCVFKSRGCTQPFPPLCPWWTSQPTTAYQTFIPIHDRNYVLDWCVLFWGMCGWITHQDQLTVKIQSNW